MAAKIVGQSPAGLFGYSYMPGAFPGGQAEFLRVPLADIGPIKIPEALTDEQVVFLSDICPMGYMATENADIEPGDTVAVWGCGPVRQFANRSAWMLGAGRVIAVDRFAARLTMAQAANAESLICSAVDIYETPQEMTGGRGPDRCLEAVGGEAHVSGFRGVYDKLKQTARFGTDHSHVILEALKCCRPFV